MQRQEACRKRVSVPTCATHRLAFTALAGLWVVVAALPSRATEQKPGGVLQKIGQTRGICAVLGDKQCASCARIGHWSELTVFVQVTDDDDLRTAAEAADAAGLYGTRIFVAKGRPAGSAWPTTWPTPWSCSMAPRTSQRPKCSACSGRKERPSAARGNDQAVSRGHRRLVASLPRPGQQSAVARPAGPGPYLTQFIAEPRYAPAPQMAVASARPGVHGLRPRRLARARRAVAEHARGRQRLQRHACSGSGR